MNPEATARQPVIHRELALETLATLRTLATDAARAAGVGSERAGHFAVAVDEAMTNAIRYAGGGRVSITVVPGESVEVEVSDDGPGIPPETPRDLPPPDAVSGRGLWLMRNLCDQLDIDTGPSGTIARLVILVSPTEAG
ncbi:ATP-binding protein [Luedemannella helvata]|uniref:Histidine kinase/HSP90-like ATPase domain-containing protein n=1 Tax=Luedemannella helvata TaxID=349315 RepID=A0ABP4WDW6_9ACTN